MTTTTSAAADSPAAHKNLRAAFTAAQSEFPAILKDKEVSFGRTRFKYASLDAIYNATRPVLNRHGLSVSHSLQPLFDGGEQQLGVSVLIVRTAIRWLGSDDEIATELPITTAGKAMKDLGAELTYARRYSLAGLLGIAADEDLDALGMEPDRSRARRYSRQQTPASASTGRRSIRDMATTTMNGSPAPPIQTLDEDTVRAITNAKDVDQLNAAMEAVTARPEDERAMYRAIMAEATKRSGAEYDAASQQFVPSSAD